MIPAGVTKAFLRVPILNDNFFEYDESFSLTLDIPQPAQNVGVMRGDTLMANVTITNDDRECFMIAMLFCRCHKQFSGLKTI